jgi:hypothetical protein
MRRAALVLILPLLAGAGATPPLPPKHIIMPLFSRVFDFHTQEAFVVQPIQRTEREVLFEFLQKGETFDNWTRLVTVRAFRGLGASPLTTRDIATRLFDPKGCLKAGGVSVGPEEQVFDTLRRTIVVISCGRSPGNAYAGDKAGGGEQDFIYLFRDDAHLYTLQYAMRGSGFDRPPIDPATAGSVLSEQFGPVLLCAGPDQPGCQEAMIITSLNGGK